MRLDAGPFGRLVLALFIVAGLGTAPAAAQAVPPEPVPGETPNIFYGLEPASPNGLVLVFIPGLHATGNEWWVNNDMYALAYGSGYRTAFISYNGLDTPNDATIVANAEILTANIPLIAQHFGTNRLVLIGHSKGGVDAQAALATPLVSSVVKALITIASPNTGSELADWAFGPGLPIAAKFDLLTPGVFAMRTENMAAFRAAMDPLLRATGVVFYTLAGNTYSGSVRTIATGKILEGLAPGDNDGLVPVSRTTLPSDYSENLGEIHANHFTVDTGSKSFGRIHNVLQGLELMLSEFRRIESDGFGDPHNTWMWSMEWFKGKLYVGTGREITCGTILTSDAQGGTNVKLYPVTVAVGACPDQDTLARSIAAEIWEFDPTTDNWRRAYKSPDSVFLGSDQNGDPLYTARDVGFRGMSTFVESDGTEALYVGGVTSGSFYDKLPIFAATGFPPPRILRSTDGVVFEALPQTPGTFFGDIGKPLPGSDRSFRSMRAFVPYKGMLFVTAGTFTGAGAVIASADPKLGDDSWFLASPVQDEFPVWDLEAFNGYLYATTGNKEVDSNPGYAIHKTDATGTPPFLWQPVVGRGGYQGNARVRAPNGLSMEVFKNQLYVGTNRPTELIRINPDDSFDVVVGEERDTPFGHKSPLTGMGLGFGSFFNGHFWRMAAHNDRLYLGTWDWSVGIDLIPQLDVIFAPHYGTDLYSTDDGVHWTAVTRTGYGDPYNFGTRLLKSTPAGLFVGTTRPQGGAEVLQCIVPDCSVVPSGLPKPPAPQHLASAPEVEVGRTAVLSWEPSPNAVRYRVYRATVRNIMDFLPDWFPIPGQPNPISLTDIQAGALNGLCVPGATDSTCALIEALAGSATAPALPDIVLSVPLPFEEIALATEPTYSEPAPTEYQSLYFVRAEDALGNLSDWSNFVGAPSKFVPIPEDDTPPVIEVTITPPPNEAGWNNSDVTVEWSVTDPESGISHQIDCQTLNISTEIAGFVAHCAAVNRRGLNFGRTVTINVDKTAPVVVFGAPDPAPNQDGWNNTDVSIPFTVSDALSGVASVSEVSPLVITGEGVGLSVTVSVADVAGNGASYASPPVNIDRTMPEVVQTFDPFTREVVVLGVDRLSGTPAQPLLPVVSVVFDQRRGGDGFDDDDRDGYRNGRHAQQRSYQVADAAGNRLTLRQDVRVAGHDLRLSIVSLQYGNRPAINAPDNRMLFEVGGGKNGTLQHVNQRIRIGKGPDRIDVHAEYETKKNYTALKWEQPTAQGRLVTGLTRLWIATDEGTLSIQTRP